jgi:hypothetical protein
MHGQDFVKTVKERRDIQTKNKNRKKKVITMEKLFRKGFPDQFYGRQSMVREDFLNATLVCMNE